MPFMPSPQQADFIRVAVERPRQSIVLEAVAGAGKTTTLLEAAEHMPGTVAILAYNKKIAEEIKEKLLKRGIDWKKAEAGTVHSFGFRQYRKIFKGVQRPNEYKVMDILEKAVVEGKIGPAVAPYLKPIAQLVSLAKQRALGVVGSISNRAEWHAINEHFDVFVEAEEAGVDVAPLIDVAVRALLSSNLQTDVIDFDDMVYMPLVHKMRFWGYDTVIIDEAQDTNASRRALVGALVKPGGRVIAVGDRHQAIYGFTGADNDSLDLIGKDFNAIRMPLTTTYRCPKAVVAFAQQWVHHIEAHETAPEGSVAASSMQELVATATGMVDGSAAVLCRVTKPLVALAFRLIREKVACRVEGREIGNGLKKLATRWKRVKSLTALEDKLNDYREKQVAKAIAAKQEVKAQNIEDQVDTLMVIIGACRAEGKDTVSDVVAHIDGLFADNVAGCLVLSTIHKSKGREWERVYWLNRTTTCPSKWARQDWQMAQEVNLQYVAATRAKAELYDLHVKEVE